MSLMVVPGDDGSVYISTKLVNVDQLICMYGQRLAGAVYDVPMDPSQLRSTVNSVYRVVDTDNGSPMPIHIEGFITRWQLDVEHLNDPNCPLFAFKDRLDLTAPYLSIAGDRVMIKRRGVSVEIVVDEDLPAVDKDDDQWIKTTDRHSSTGYVFHKRLASVKGLSIVALAHSIEAPTPGLSEASSISPYWFSAETDPLVTAYDFPRLSSVVISATSAALPYKLHSFVIRTAIALELGYSPSQPGTAVFNEPQARVWIPATPYSSAAGSNFATTALAVIPRKYVKTIGVQPLPTKTNEGVIHRNTRVICKVDNDENVSYTLEHDEHPADGVTQLVPRLKFSPDDIGRIWAFPTTSHGLGTLSVVPRLITVKDTVWLSAIPGVNAITPPGYELASGEFTFSFDIPESLEVTTADKIVIKRKSDGAVMKALACRIPYREWAGLNAVSDMHAALKRLVGYPDITLGHLIMLLPFVPEGVTPPSPPAIPGTSSLLQSLGSLGVAAMTVVLLKRGRRRRALDIPDVRDDYLN